MQIECSAMARWDKNCKCFVPILFWNILNSVTFLVPGSMSILGGSICFFLIMKMKKRNVVPIMELLSGLGIGYIAVSETAIYKFSWLFLTKFSHVLLSTYLEDLLHLPNGAKMSKSLKNSITVREFLETYSAEQFRMMCVVSNYRNGMLSYMSSFVKIVNSIFYLLLLHLAVYDSFQEWILPRIL